jgi:hypothetical protein
MRRGEEKYAGGQSKSKKQVRKPDSAVTGRYVTCCQGRQGIGKAVTKQNHIGL